MYQEMPGAVILMVLVFLIALAFGVYKCDSKEQHKPASEYWVDASGYRVVELDSCEYIIKYMGYQNGYIFTHKGNCKNPIHYKR